jgi:hypothetical protein
MTPQYKIHGEERRELKKELRDKKLAYEAYTMFNRMCEVYGGTKISICITDQLWDDIKKLKLILSDSYKPEAL